MMHAEAGDPDAIIWLEKAVAFGKAKAHVPLAALRNKAPQDGP